MTPLVVDERVRRDHAGDHEPERDAHPAVGRSPRTSRIPATTRHDPGTWPTDVACPSTDDADRPARARAHPAGDRIDDRERQRSGRRSRAARSRRAEAPARDDNGQTARSIRQTSGDRDGEHDLGRQERDRRRRLGVARTREQHVPERVHDGGGEREQQRRSSASTNTTIFTPDGDACSDLRLQRHALGRRAHALRDLRPPLRRARQADVGTGVLRRARRALRSRDRAHLARVGPSRGRRRDRGARSSATGRLVADGSSVHEHTREAVRYAAERVPLAICSGAARAEIEPVVEAAGLTALLRCIVSLRRRRRGQAAPRGLSEGARIARRRTQRRPPSSRTPRRASRRRKRRASGTCSRCARTLDPHRLGGADELIDRIDVDVIQRLLSDARDRPPRRVGRAAGEHIAGVRARDRAGRRLRRARRAQRPQRHPRRAATRRRLSDARRGARPLPRPHRRDGRAEASARRHGPARARADAATTTCSSASSAVRSRRRASCAPRCAPCSTSASASRSAGRRAPGRSGFRNDRVTRRGLESARRAGLATTVYTVNDEARMLELARARRHRDLHGLSGSSTGSPGPSSGRLRSFAPSAGIRATTLRADRQRGGPRGRHVGDQARPVPSPSAVSPGRGTSGSSTSPVERVRAGASPFVRASSSSDSGRIRIEHALAVRAAARRVDLKPHAAVIDLDRSRRPRPSPRGGSSCR